MSDAERILPLFPLGTVLFPGLVLPLHVFEQRYRELVRSLLTRPPPERLFGVVAIRRGWEVAQPAPESRATGWRPGEVDIYDIGCTAQIRTVTEHPDGTYDLVTVGRHRYAIRKLIDAPTPYAQAAVTFLPERPGPDGAAEALGPRVLAALRSYLRAYPNAAGQEQLPEDPPVLSYLVAAAASLPLTERQALLAAPDTATRLRDALRLLQRETILVSRVRAVPASLADLVARPDPN